LRHLNHLHVQTAAKVPERREANATSRHAQSPRVQRLYRPECVVGKPGGRQPGQRKEWLLAQAAWAVWPCPPGTMAAIERMINPFRAR
jgi:hypothetical protein